VAGKVELAFDKAAEVDARTRAFNKGLLEGERRLKSAEESMRWLPFIPARKGIVTERRLKPVRT
jgi:hypothetical protein